MKTRLDAELVRRGLARSREAAVELIENRKVFKDENELSSHISFIKNEISLSNKDIRMKELINWLKENTHLKPLF